jgi:hypothetical protein
MGYGLAHGSKSFVHVLEEVIEQWLIVYLSQSFHESGRIGGGSNYGICERRKNFLNLDFHENKISKQVM